MDRQQFSSEDGEFVAYLKAGGFAGAMSAKNLEDEFACLVRTYYSRAEKEEDPEDTKVCPLSELNLLTIADTKTREYKKVSPEKDDIHPMVAYAVMMDNLNGRTEIPIDTLKNEPRNIGKVFNLDKSALIHILEKIEFLGYIEIVRTAGLDVINIRQPLEFLQCIENYYINLAGGRI